MGDASGDGEVLEQRGRGVRGGADDLEDAEAGGAEGVGIDNRVRRSLPYDGQAFLGHAAGFVLDQSVFDDGRPPDEPRRSIDRDGQQR